MVAQLSSLTKVATGSCVSNGVCSAMGAAESDMNKAVIKNQLGPVDIHLDAIKAAARFQLAV